MQKSLKQLYKGKAFLEKISRILETDTWKHVCFVCFPEIESKEAFIGVANAQDFKVIKQFFNFKWTYLKAILTRAELKSLDEKWWEKVCKDSELNVEATGTLIELMLNQLIFFYAEDEFKNIANLLVGSFYVSSTNQSFDKLKLIRDYNNDTINRIGELYESIILSPHVT